jgi:hypothetical protein
MSHYTQKSLIYAVFIACMVVLVSCKSANSTGEAPQDTKKDTGILKTYERSPVTVTLQTDKQEITVADRLNLTISATADEEYEVELPGFGDKLEQFGIVDYHTSQPKLTEDKRSEISRSYVLEPFLSGDYAIPPMTVNFWKKGAKDTDNHNIETEEITIHVVSILPEDLEKRTLHDIRPPVALPTSSRVWIWSGTFAGAVLCIGLVAFVLIKRRRKTDETVQRVIPAHELAFNELEALITENLVDKGEIKQFYQRISDILRRYIERRFGIHAPEQTTEEFLAGIKTRSDFPETYHGLVKNFLTHCDLVKFAEHQPTTENIQQIFDSCKDFIMGTQHAL